MAVSIAAPAPATARFTSLVPLILVGIVLLMVVPLPPMLLDLLLACSIAISIGLLLVSLHLEKPLDLSALPTMLLFSTLLRLALNVASTRLILMHGDQGTNAAGAIIRAFGEFMVGGNYVVGAAVFLLLVIINFVVITKGSGRVAEVAARFALDSLPGKQMSIDADLASGAITQAEARVRRQEIEHAADFFGSMDGASKFVRGDAIAGLLMTGINIVVGFIVGVAQQGMSVAEAASTYTTLTVGDGLAAQVPALLVSTAAGVVVTKAAGSTSVAHTLVAQLGGHRSALRTASMMVAGVGVLPGMPMLPFLLLGGALGLASRQSATVKSRTIAAEPPKNTEKDERQRVENLLNVELMELEVGFELLPLVDGAQGGELVERVAAIRRNLAADLGILVPSIHIRDNLRLKANEYRLLFSGNEVGRGDLRPRKHLAMDPSGLLPAMAGEQVREPAFGLPAWWIASSKCDEAERLGYTVVDAATVVATHLTEMLRGLAPELLGRTEVKELIDIFAKREPRMIDELIPAVISVGDLVKVLRGLLRESVSIRDLRSILEALADHAKDAKSSDELGERVRQRLARQISARFKAEDGSLAALIVDPQTEEKFRRGLLDAQSMQRLMRSLDDNARSFAQVATPPAILCAADVRHLIFQTIGKRIPGISILSYQEVDPKTSVRSLGIVTS